MVFQQCVGDKTCQECLGQLMAGRQGLVIGWCNILLSCWPGGWVLAWSGLTDMIQLWIIRESSWVTIPLVLLLFIDHTVFGTEEHIYPKRTSVGHTIIRDSTAFCCRRAISSTKTTMYHRSYCNDFTHCWSYISGAEEISVLSISPLKWQEGFPGHLLPKGPTMEETRAALTMMNGRH